MPTLDIWMNGALVGHWTRHAGIDRLTYSREWMDSPQGRPISLSLPYARAAGGQATIRSAAVGAFFDNLLPDNDRILQRIRDRHRLRSTQAFDLLAAVGRDCAGALQLVPEGAEPGNPRIIEGSELDDAGVAAVLRAATLDRLPTQADPDAFRISIAGAQEKTALLRHEGKWQAPLGATPSTHILKLPLGLVGNMRADLSSSVELEWLCLEIARAFGLPVAKAEIGFFEDQKALVVERFDRRLASDGSWYIRIPQEDMCQAHGIRADSRYETDGGPGIREIMALLRGSTEATADRVTFFRAQVLYWLMAATDGHAKNFSLVLMPGGAYRLAPLYDILSTYPIQGRGPGQLDPRRAKMAMAVCGKNRHYGVADIHHRHWVAMAEQLGLETSARELIAGLGGEVEAVLDEVGNRLPPTFPSMVFDVVRDGMMAAAWKLGVEAGSGASHRVNGARRSLESG